MHWSKSRHVAYEGCPRQFFYSEIAAPRNPNIAALVDRRSPPLVRHDVVRGMVIALAKAKEVDVAALDEALAGARSVLEKAIPDEYEVNAQMSIVDTCVRSFVRECRSRLEGVPILYAFNGQPSEFTYDGQAMMCLVEIALDRGDRTEILAFKTGSSDFRSEREFSLRAGGLTCWARSVLKCVDHPVAVTEVYLREECTLHQVVLGDAEVTEFVRKAKKTASSYSATAKIRDFEARPDWSGCRFCAFKEICPEWKEFAEVDYDLSALALQLESRFDKSPSAGCDVTRRVAFLSHVGADKEMIVSPFARALESEGISYWLDEAEILWGDSLTKSVNDGLAQSDFVVCFLSSSFCGRGWPEGELGAALSTEFYGGGQRVLPVIVGDKEKIFREYPLLRDKKCVMWQDGIDSIVSNLKAVIARGGSAQQTDPTGGSSGR